MLGRCSLSAPASRCGSAGYCLSRAPSTGTCSSTSDTSRARCRLGERDLVGFEDRASRRGDEIDEVGHPRVVDARARDLVARVTPAVQGDQDGVAEPILGRLGVAVEGASPHEIARDVVEAVESLRGLHRRPRRDPPRTGARSAAAVVQTLAARPRDPRPFGPRAVRRRGARRAHGHGEERRHRTGRGRADPENFSRVSGCGARTKRTGTEITNVEGRADATWPRLVRIEKHGLNLSGLSYDLGRRQCSNRRFSCRSS
jgi:hypothetical protein